MFTVQRVLNGTAYPVPLLYVDTLRERYLFENIRIRSTHADATLGLPGVTAACDFAGDPFPLVGSAYLTAVTGTLAITVTHDLSTGKHYVPFMTSSQSVLPLVGMSVHGVSLMGLAVPVWIAISTVVCIQSFAIPGVSLAPPATSTGRVPILHGP